MPSKIWTDEQLKNQLKQRVALLHRMLSADMVPIVIARQTAIVVSTLRLMDEIGGKINLLIGEEYAMIMARESGLCGMCQKVLAETGSELCKSCDQEAEEISLLYEDTQTGSIM